MGLTNTELGTQERRERVQGAWRRWLPVGLPMGAILASTALLFTYTRDVDRAQIGREFETQTTNVARGLSEDLRHHHEIVESIGSLYAVDDAVDRHEFSAFVQRNLRAHKGIQALEWIPRVPSHMRVAFEEAAQEDGHTEFRIKRWMPGGSLPCLW